MNEFSLSPKTERGVLGTLWLVPGGCGSAVLAAAFPQVGIGPLCFDQSNSSFFLQELWNGLAENSCTLSAYPSNFPC